MTPNANAQRPDDLLREHLSAMMDGALTTDESRFLLRRMEHDDALADTWQRWQLYGDAMRGHAGRLLPPDFAARVGRAIADDAALADAAVPATRSRALRWGGGAAVAASVALAALLGTRTLVPGPGLDGDAGPPAVAPVPVAVNAAPVAGAVVQPAITSSDAAVALAQDARASSGQPKPRIMAADAAEPAATRRPSAAIVAAGPAVDATVPSSGASDAPVARPWPRSLLGDGHGGSMSAGFGTVTGVVDPLADARERPVTRFGPPARPFPAVGATTDASNAAGQAQGNAPSPDGTTGAGDPPASGTP